MNYIEYTIKRQEEYNALPIFYAFSNEQFKREMEKRGLTEKDTDKIYKLGNTGGFYLKSDVEIIHNFFSKKDELPELMRDHEFAVSAFEYEMENHEYAINYYQGDWDVCSCFGNCEYSEEKTYSEYLTEMGYSYLVDAYREAKKIYYNRCEENEWF